MKGQEGVRKTLFIFNIQIYLYSGAILCFIVIYWRKLNPVRNVHNYLEDYKIGTIFVNSCKKV